MTDSAGSRSQRITVWPGFPVGVPTVPAAEVRLLDDESTLVFGVPAGGSRDLRTVTLRPDFHLREFRDLDASDPQEVLAFCQQWGPVGSAECDDLHIYSRSAAREADAAIADPWGRLVPSPTAGELRRESLELGTKLGFWHGMILQVHSVARVAYYQAALWNAVELWRLVSGKATPDELMANWRQEDVGAGSDRTAWVQEGDAWRIAESRPSESEAISDLANHLNPALVPFHVRLAPYPFGADTAVNVYQAACLLLANDIAERVPYGHCANERCGRLFSRQRGRSESDQYRRKGVIYCSANCARAQAQRNVRRNKKTERRPQDGRTGEQPVSNTKGAANGEQAIQRRQGHEGRDKKATDGR